MFKAAFPWATTEEEVAERKHHKTLPTAGHEEVAGNVWISPEHGMYKRAGTPVTRKSWLTSDVLQHLNWPESILCALGSLHF
jgi:hypothetical protein